MENTGYKSFDALELYYTDDDSYAGKTKDNLITDPDYIAPIKDNVSCPPSTRYYNEKRTLEKTKNDCPRVSQGTSVTLIADANMFVSYLSIADANKQADLWLEENAQIYANNAGTCGL